MKISALGVLLLAGSTILAACDGNRNYPPPSSATPVASSSGKVPTQADIDACNEYAHDQTKSGTGEVVKDAAIGGLGGAAVGAGGGAIAGGGAAAKPPPHHRPRPGLSPTFPIRRICRIPVVSRFVHIHHEHPLTDPLSRIGSRRNVLCAARGMGAPERRSGGARCSNHTYRDS